VSYRNKQLETDDRASVFDKIVDDMLNELYVFEKTTLRFLYANKRACENVGYTFNELLQLTPLDLIPEHRKPTFESLLLLLKNDAKEKVEFETIHKREDGSHYPVEAHIQLTEYQSNNAFIAVVLDLTEHKLSYQRLQKNEQQLAAILNNAVECIISIDNHGLITSLNPATERIFGYSEEELVGKNVNILMPAPWKEKHNDYLHHYLSTGEKKIIGIGREVSGLRKDGSTFPIELSVGEIITDKEHSFTGVIRDISELKQAQEEHKQHEEEKRQNQERFDRLSRVSAVGELAASIAHEINQPLTAVGTYAAIANQLINNEPPDIQNLQSILGKINEQTKRASKVIHRLRSLINKHEVQHESVDINELIRNIINISSPQALSRAIEIEFEPVIPTPPVECDYVNIQQVILNLINNAIDAMDNIDVNDLSQRKIIIRISQNSANILTIFVRDFGKGIAETERQKIFSPFYTTKPDGMGVGLSISRSIMEAHSGALSLTDGITDGSEFTLTLPLSLDS